MKQESSLRDANANVSLERGVSNSNQSIKKFLCLGSSIGAVALGINLFLFVLLGLGYAD
ncbi:hypothetical protein [Anabaena azotica]|uniref:Uncharacterized protein n=1 Tax=Anabaena azotica FACHB-119 TaxID=947527 RepID=A0ABR8D0X0_9NOST|nr:hypothetical protein [Anabaena azotica]MBD2500577.1 hypothetical protein [Anabaena azotica FACHB-119]